MPYITPDRRISRVDLPLAQNAGELNYLITMLVLRYWHAGEYNYQSLNDILGALDGSKMEFYRRVVAPYEDGKIKINGDVY